MARAIFKNRSSGAEVFIIRRLNRPLGEMLQCQYLNSDKTSYFYKDDFDRMFEYDRVEYNA